MIVIGRYIEIIREVVVFYYGTCNRRGPEWLLTATAQIGRGVLEAPF